MQVGSVYVSEIGQKEEALLGTRLPWLEGFARCGFCVQKVAGDLLTQDVSQAKVKRG